jgi:uncharacterized transporter YbjL
MSMDLLGIILFIVGVVLYFIRKPRPAGWLFVAGFGAGLLVSAIIIGAQLRMLLP